MLFKGCVSWEIRAHSASILSDRSVVSAPQAGVSCLLQRQTEAWYCHFPERSRSVCS